MYALFTVLLTVVVCIVFMVEDSVITVSEVLIGSYKSSLVQETNNTDITKRLRNSCFSFIVIFFTKVIKLSNFSNFFQIFISMIIDKIKLCLLEIENNGVMRSGKSQTINNN